MRVDRVTLRLPKIYRKTQDKSIKFAEDMKNQALKDITETRTLAKDTTFFDEYINNINEILNDIRDITITGLFAQQLVTVKEALKAFGKEADYLCPAEYIITAKHIVSAFTVFQAIKSANFAVEMHYGYPQQGEKTDGTNSNAFYHAFWNASLAFNIGLERAKKFTDAHEFGKPDNFRSSISILKTKMDLINNSVGLNIGSEGRDPQYFEIYLSSTIHSKLIENNTPLRRLNKDKTGLIPANGDKDCLTYFN